MEINGQSINYKISGEGNSEIVIILQGWGACLETYDAIAGRLGVKYRVIQFDFPGFGNSPDPIDSLTLDDYVDIFEQFCLKLCVKKATLVCHSFGGRVAIKLLTDVYSNLKVEKLLLIDSAGIKDDMRFVDKLKLFKYKFLRTILGSRFVYYLFPIVIDEWFSHQGSDDYRHASDVMKQCLINTVNEDLSDNLKQINKPTFIIWGSDDIDTPLEHAYTMHKAIKESKLFVIKNAGHYPFLEQPEAFFKVLKEIL